MLREQTVYVCTCSKCNHKWITKVKEIPVRCAKCNRVTWNDDQTHATFAPEDVGQPLAPVTLAPGPYTYIESIETVEPVDQWQGWSEERQAPDHESGETVTYRQHLKKGTRKEIRRASAW